PPLPRATYPAEAECDRSDLVVSGCFPGPPIHGLVSPASRRGHSQLQCIPGEADGGFQLHPVIVWDQRNLILPDEGLVRLIDRPRTTIRAEPVCRHRPFLCRCRRTGIAGGFEFGAVRDTCHESVVPTGIKDEDALRIGTIGLLFGAVWGD